jgi:hypothetical protein
MPGKAKQPKRGFPWRNYENSQLRNVLEFSVVLYKFILKDTVACEHDKNGLLIQNQTIALDLLSLKLFRCGVCFIL